MRGVWDILYLRRPVLNYVSPPVCEVVFSGSSNPVIILSANVLVKVSGLAIGGFGGFQLTWNRYPGAICYNVYFRGGTDVYTILAQCVTDPNYPLPPDIGPGEVIVTAVTEDGESPPSDPIPTPVGGGSGTDTVFVTAQCPSASQANFPGAFAFHRDFTAGSLTIHYTMSGTATNGTDYEPVSGVATFPNGVNEIMLEIVPIEAVLASNKTVIVTINSAPNYATSAPDSATIYIRRPFLRVKNYGTVGTPLFTPAPAGNSTEQPGAVSAGCEWDGTLNYLIEYPNNFLEYSYRDTDGNFEYPPGINESIQGTQVRHIILAGPYPPGFSPLIRWQMQISGQKQNGNPYVIWQGFRTQAEGGNTGDGIYQLSGSEGISDLRPTVEFEFF